MKDPFNSFNPFTKERPRKPTAPAHSQSLSSREGELTTEIDAICRALKITKEIFFCSRSNYHCGDSCAIPVAQGFYFLHLYRFERFETGDF